VGFPGYKGGDSKLTPRDIPGVIKDPPYEGIQCDGKDLRGMVSSIEKDKQLNLELILEMYKAFPDKSKFFNAFFEKLAGTDLLRKQIESGKSAEEIRASWQKDLDVYKNKRKRYLLYQD
jgi:hypothetical protein